MSIVDPFTLKLYSVTEPRGRELLKAYIATYMDGGSKRSSKSNKTLPDCDTRNLGDPVLGDPTDIISFFLADVHHDAGDLMNFYSKRQSQLLEPAVVMMRRGNSTIYQTTIDINQKINLLSQGAFTSFLESTMLGLEILGENAYLKKILGNLLKENLIFTTRATTSTIQIPNFKTDLTINELSNPTYIVKDTIQSSVSNKIKGIITSRRRVVDCVSVSQWLDPSPGIFVNLSGVVTNIIKKPEINYFGRFNEICNNRLYIYRDDTGSDVPFFRSGINCKMEYVPVTNPNHMGNVKLTINNIPVITGRRRNCSIQFRTREKFHNGTLYTGPVSYNSNSDTSLFYSILNKLKKCFTTGDTLRTITWDRRPGDTTDGRLYETRDGREVRLTVDNVGPDKEFPIDIYKIVNFDVDGETTFGLLTLQEAKDLENNRIVIPWFYFIDNYNPITSILFEICKIVYSSSDSVSSSEEATHDKADLISTALSKRIVRNRAARKARKARARKARAEAAEVSIPPVVYDDFINDIAKLILLLKHCGDGGSASMAHDLNKMCTNNVIYTTNDRLAAAEFLKRYYRDPIIGKATYCLQSTNIFRMPGESVYPKPTNKRKTNTRNSIGSKKPRKGGSLLSLPSLSKKTVYDELSEEVEASSEEVEESAKRFELEMDFRPSFTVYPDGDDYIVHRFINRNIFVPDPKFEKFINENEITIDGRFYVESNGIDISIYDRAVATAEEEALSEKDPLYTFQGAPNPTEFTKNMSIILKYVINNSPGDITELMGHIAEKEMARASTYVKPADATESDLSIVGSDTTSPMAVDANPKVVASSASDMTLSSKTQLKAVDAKKVEEEAEAEEEESEAEEEAEEAEKIEAAAKAKTEIPSTPPKLRTSLQPPSSPGDTPFKSPEFLRAKYRGRSIAEKTGVRDDEDEYLSSKLPYSLPEGSQPTQSDAIIISDSESPERRVKGVKRKLFG